MKKIFTFLKDLIVVLVVLAFAFGAGYFFCYISSNRAVKVIEDNKDSFDLELPLEVEKRVVTVEEVESRLVEIGELSTYAGEYTCTLGKEETRYWLEKVPVIGSTNSITITCDGIVKVGYDLSEIVARVDDDKIYISIPEARLNDNYVIWDSLVCDESNNILNPIEFPQYREIIDEIEKMGYEQAKEQGVYKKAERNLKVLINAFLAEFEGYEIIYM